MEMEKEKDKRLVELEPTSSSFLVCVSASLLLGYCKYEQEIYLDFTVVMSPLIFHCLLNMLNNGYELYSLDTEQLSPLVMP